MTKQLNYLKLFLLGLCFSTIVSCNDEPNLTENPVSSYDKEAYLKLGTKLENPYSVKNMKRALDSVRANTKTSKTSKISSSLSDFDIETSHLYVKIEPKDATQEALC
jgi:hypothetical protein